MKTNTRFVPVDSDANEDADFAPNPTHEQIAVVAYQLYEDEGFPDGLADSHWHAAEVRLRE